MRVTRSRPRRQLDAVRAGRDPAGTSFDPDAAPVRFEAGNYLLKKPAHST